MIGGLGACAAGPDAGTVAIADSSGITIYRNAPPDGLKLNGEPLAVMGGYEADTAAILSNIRDLAALPDGRVVVGDEDRSVRWYHPDGQLLRRVGRLGDGPGEFREIHLVRRIRGDTVVVFDVVQQRGSYLTADGEFVRSQQLVPPGIFFPYDFVEDGRVLGLVPIPVADRSPSVPGRWARVPVLLFDAATGVADTIGSYLADRCRDDVQDRCAQAGYATPVRAFRNGAIAANADENRLVAFSDSGEIEFIIELGVEGWVHEIVADDDGGIWVEVADEEARQNVWLRIDLESGRRTAVRVARSIRLRSVLSPDRIVATHRDSLGVQTVRVLQLEP